MIADLSHYEIVNFWNHVQNEVFRYCFRFNLGYLLLNWGRWVGPAFLVFDFIISIKYIFVFLSLNLFPQYRHQLDDLLALQIQDFPTIFPKTRLESALALRSYYSNIMRFQTSLISLALNVLHHFLLPINLLLRIGYNRYFEFFKERPQLNIFV